MASRYGAGELYGYDFSGLTPQCLRTLARAANKDMVCPFRPPEAGKAPPKCNKKGGVCSLRQFVSEKGGEAVATGEPVTTCPSRFMEGGTMLKWVGETLLGTATPSVISELPFLLGDQDEDPDPVGKIDKVLVNDAGPALHWCALEMQAVYFSGMAMENDFKEMRDWKGPGIPAPKVQRRPDFRSSGPKRLMPQLQIKVPTITRWGKKMAVVIDKAFWDSLSPMREVKDASNCDIAWFVVSFAAAKEGRFSLQRHSVHCTTLSHAVEGLTGGTPMSLDRFEAEIRARLPKP